MVDITAVTPPRFQAGDTLVIDGLAFSPDFGENFVTIDTIPATIVSESDTQLVVTVPAGITQDAFVAVQVQRGDTGENTATQRWSRGPTANLRSGALVVPGQVPGVLEAADPTPVPDTFQAQDYDAYLSFLAWWLYEVATTKGDLWATDGVAPMQPQAVGAAGLALIAQPAALLGLAYAAAPAAGRLTHEWAKQIDAPGAANGPMVANGLSTDQSVAKGEHAAGIAGTVAQLIVLVQVAVGGDTLDQVQITQNGVVVYDSGAGLALGQGASHAVNPALVVAAADRLAINAFKAGVAGAMQLRGKLGVV